jgi:hypothetical protein
MARVVRQRVSSPSLHGEKLKPEATGPEHKAALPSAAVAPKLGGKRPHDHEDYSDRGEAKRNRNQRQQHVNGRIPSAEPRAPDRKIAVRPIVERGWRKKSISEPNRAGG